MCYSKGTKGVINEGNENACSPLSSSRARVSGVRRGELGQVCSRGQIIRVLDSMPRNLGFYHIGGGDSLKNNI